MIRCEHIQFKIGKKILLDDIDCSFESGKLNLIIGPNGAGKSTLIKILSRQLQPQKGSVFFDEKNLLQFSAQELAKIRAVLSQNIDLAFPMQVREVVMMGRYPHFSGKPQKQDHQACSEAMELFGVTPFADRNYLSLSGGEKQRVQFARVFAQIWYKEAGQRYILLDEPLTFLDIKFQYLFLKEIKRIVQNENLLAIGVLHELNFAAQFADDLLLLHEGKIMAKGMPSAVLTEENILQTFGLRMKCQTTENGLILSFVGI
ncbi:MAG: heme ABC transporter ATP-binding protein [Crocinitomicaceae bacterium]